MNPLQTLLAEIETLNPKYSAWNQHGLPEPKPLTEHPAWQRLTALAAMGMRWEYNGAGDRRWRLKVGYRDFAMIEKDGNGFRCELWVIPSITNSVSLEHLKESTEQKVKMFFNDLFTVPNVDK